MTSEPHRLTPAQLGQSLAATLAGWNGRCALWVFAYGSLIWKPELDYDLRVPARVHGYHRKLCLRSIRYRGTLDCPGIVAGLDRGGSCLGVAYRVPAAAVHRQFEALWEREMFMGSYQPRWLHCHRGGQSGGHAGGRGARLSALAFVVRHDAPNYCGRLPEAQLIDILRRACGHYGSSLDYLQRTVTALHEAGLRDPHLERLARLALAPMGDPAPTAR